MAMSRLKKNVVAAALAGSMVIALPGAAFATTVEDNGSIVDKTWTAASNTQLNNTEVFKFQIEYTGADKVGTWEPDFTMGANTCTLTANWQDLSNGSNSASAPLYANELFKGYEFKTPGVYKFTLTEVRGDNPNILYATNSYNVEVSVAMPTDYPTHTDPVIQKIQVKDGDNKADKAAFANTAKANDSLKVSKKVAGTAANTQDEFKYTLTLGGVQGSYGFEKHTKDGGIETGTVTNGADPYEFTLYHGEYIEIKNLPVGATYTVLETDTAYTETNVADDVKSDGDKGAQADGAIKAGGSTVAYTNEKGFAPATGVNSDTMPFVFGGLVVVAGAGALLISRKRRASEEF